MFESFDWRSFHMTNQTTSEQSRAVVDAYYQAGVPGRLTNFRDGTATSIWVAYFEPQALLDKLGIAHGLRR
jgi:hypothetical protein